MTIYFLLPVFSFFLGAFLYKFKWGKRLYSILFFAALFLIGALRQYTGFDYVLYDNWYHDLINHTIDSIGGYYRVEKGFLIPLKLMRDAGLSSYFVFGSIAFVIALLLITFIEKKSSIGYFSLTAFIIFGFFFNSMNFMRQMIAALLISFAFQYIEDKQFFRYIALVLFASVFHISALIMIPFYFFLRIRMNSYTIPVFTVLSLAIWFYSRDILNFVTAYFYTAYSDLINNPEIGSGLPLYYTISFLIFTVLAVILLWSEQKKNKIYITAMFFGVFFEFIGIKHGVVSRLALYFLIPAIIVLTPRMYEKIKSLILQKYYNDKKMRLTVGALTVISVLLFLGFTYGNFLYRNYNGVVPYNTYFSGRTFEEFEFLRDNAVRR